MARCRASSKTSGSALKKTAFAREQDRPDAARYRKRWRARQDSGDPRRLVFLDETWVKTNMAPLRGWGARGRRLIGKAPHGRWRTLTFLAALRVDRIEAPCVFDGPINGERFRAYAEQFLVRTLQPGDIVVLDNLGSHKGRRSAKPSAPQARTGFSCRPTVLISILSCRSSPSSSSGYAKPEQGPSPTCMTPSLTSFSRSPHVNAQLTSGIADMLPNKMTPF